MKNNIYKLILEGNFQMKESWVELYLNSNEKIEGQIVDFNKYRVLIAQGEFNIDEEILIIPMDIIKYLGCVPCYFNIDEDGEN